MNGNIATQGAVAAIAVILVSKVVWDWLKGRRAGSSNGVLTELKSEVHGLGEKVDNLRVEIASNYARRSDVTELSVEIRDVHDRAIKSEANVETLTRQMSEVFRRVNA